MKKAVSVLLAMVMAGALAGCSSGPKAAGDTSLAAPSRNGGRAFRGGNGRFFCSAGGFARRGRGYGGGCLTGGFAERADVHGPGVPDGPGKPREDGQPV